MTNDTQVSVIIPIYNVEKYLNECIESVLAQTYTKLNIILVDDGSTDTCPKIVDLYQKQDSRIKVIHKTNGGLSDARNAGLTIATGDWILFLDSDDVLLPVAIEKLLDVQRKSGTDIVVGNYSYYYSENHVDQADTVYTETTVLNNYQAMKALVIGEIQNFAWGKLIRKSLAEKFQFPKGKLFEDNYWAHLVFGEADSVAVITDPLIMYRQREGSISYTFTPSRLDIIEGWISRMQFLKVKYPELVPLFGKHISGIYVQLAWLVLTRMSGKRKKAWGRMNALNKQLTLEEFAQGYDKVLISALNKSHRCYVIKALLHKVLGK